MKWSPMQPSAQSPLSCCLCYIWRSYWLEITRHFVEFEVCEWHLSFDYEIVCRAANVSSIKITWNFDKQWQRLCVICQESNLAICTQLPNDKTSLPIFWAWWRVPVTFIHFAMPFKPPRHHQCQQLNLVYATHIINTTVFICLFTARSNFLLRC